MPQRRTKGDGSLYKRPDGTWIGMVSLVGRNGVRTRRSVSGRDRNLVAQKLKQLQRDIDEGMEPASPNTTTEAWLERWLEEIAKPRLKPRTYATYRSTVKTHILPELGHKRLSKLGAADVRRMTNAVAAHRSTRTSQIAYNVLAKALKDAVREGLLRSNPCDRVDRPAALHQERAAMSIPDIRTLFTHLNTMGDDPMVSRIAMALLTGARQAECLGLEWDRVDFDTKMIDISWTLQRVKLKTTQRPQFDLYPKEMFDVPPAFDFRPVWRSFCLVPPKTVRSRRIVPMIPILEAALLAHRERTGGTGLVWTRENGAPLLDRDDSKAWRDTLLAAGLGDEEGTVPTLHSARHTVATLLQGAGVDEAVRMQLLGHSSVAAHRGYAHVDQTLTRAALGELGKLLA